MDECERMMVLIVTIRQVVFVFVWMKMAVVHCHPTAIEIVILHDFDAIHY